MMSPADRYAVASAEAAEAQHELEAEIVAWLASRGPEERRYRRARVRFVICDLRRARARADASGALFFRGIADRRRGHRPPMDEAA